MSVSAEYYKKPKPRAKEPIGIIMFLLLLIAIFLVLYFYADVGGHVRWERIKNAFLMALLFVSVTIVLIKFIYYLWCLSPFPSLLRDRRAHRIVNSNDGIILLLRPFEFDELISILPSETKNIDEHGSHQPQSMYEYDSNDLREPVEMFDLLTDTLTRQGKLIAVGQRRLRHRGGPGLVSFTDADWRERVSELIERSTIIFLMPWPSEGTRWELNNILVNNMVEKTIFIMPPSYGYKKERHLVTELFIEQAGESNFYYKVPTQQFGREHPLSQVCDGYSRAVVELSRAGFSPPEYDANGGLFFYQDGKLQVVSIPYTDSEMDNVLGKLRAYRRVTMQ